MTPSKEKDASNNDERRQHVELRETLEELVSYVRSLANERPDMSDEDLEYAHQRLEWLAEETWLALKKIEPH